MKEQPLLHLSLNPDEIDTLLTVLGCVGGDIHNTRRRYSETIREKLRSNGFVKYNTNDVHHLLNTIQFIPLKFPMPKHDVGTELKVIATDSVWHGILGVVVEALIKTTIKELPLDEAVYILRMQDKKDVTKFHLVAFPESDLSS